MIVKTRLSRLLLTSRENIITKADDIKLSPAFKYNEDGSVTEQYNVEVINPIDYTKGEFKKKFNGNKMISRWCHILEDDIEKLVIVID